VSRYYDIDPTDPYGPRELTEWEGLKPGMHVRYENPAWKNADGTFKTGGMDPPLVIEELISFPADSYPRGYVEAILNNGDWQVNARNLVEDK
jgi:hypothetical protein